MIDYTVGDEVVCVDPEVIGGDGQCDDKLLEENRIYRVVAMAVAEGFYYRDRSSNTLVITQLAEVKNPYNRHGFAAIRFRKVQKRPTDISVFEGMLTKKVREKELS